MVFYGNNSQNVLIPGCLILCSGIQFFVVIYIILFHQETDKQQPNTMQPSEYEPGIGFIDRTFLQHRKLSYYESHHTSNKMKKLKPDKSNICVYDLTSKIPMDTELYECIRTKTTPNFKICIHDIIVDKFISNHLKNGGIWEPYLTKLISKALDNYPNAITVDIGANIGYYSLMSCVKDHFVIAIEPNYGNIVRFHQGAIYNNCQNKIILLQNALYDTYKNVTLTSSKDNQGGIWIDTNLNLDIVSNNTLGINIVKTTTLNDILGVSMIQQAIVKIDIEGYECKVFKKAEQFLKTVHVPYIFMEWRKMYLNKDKPSSVCRRHHMKQLSLSLTQLGYSPYEVHTGFQLDPHRSSEAWKVGDIYWQHHTAPDLMPPY